MNNLRRFQQSFVWFGHNVQDLDPLFGTTPRLKTGPKIEKSVILQLLFGAMFDHRDESERTMLGNHLVPLVQ